MKKCSKCKKLKPQSEFGADRRASDGLRCSCRTCGSATSGAWNRAHRTAYNAYRKLYQRHHRARVLVSTCKVRAKKIRVPFDLDSHREEIQRRIDVGCCEVSGFPFDLENGRTFASPSIDRIVPAKGYVYSNIRVVCDAMNLAMGDWGEEKLYAVVTAWLGKRAGKGTPSGDGRRTETQDGSTPVLAI